MAFPTPRSTHFKRTFMRSVTFLTPEQAVAEANRFGVTSDVAGTNMDAMISSMEIREIDSCLPEAKDALRHAIGSSALPMGHLKTVIHHPEARESDKLWLPKHRHAAWDETVDIRVGALRVGEPTDPDRGYLFIVQKREGALPALWACDHTRAWVPERAVNMLIPETLDVLRKMGEPNGVGEFVAHAEKTELSSAIPPAPASPRPRV